MSVSKESLYVKHKKDGDFSSVWSHFLVAKQGSTAQCKYCAAILKILGGSTKGLHTHLLSRHSTKVDSTKPSCSTIQSDREPRSKCHSNSFADFFTKIDTLEDVLARMTALDGFPFSVFSTSKDLRTLFLAKGYTDLPKSAPTICKYVVNYSQKLRKQIKAELSTLKNEGHRFSLSFDEWTSNSNKRYMNINIHSEKKLWNLGLIRINESLTAETSVRVLKVRLSEFDITLDGDIVAIVTDGPNVMLKVGKLVNVEHQLCFAHGIHLAVCDLLYKTIPFAAVNESINSDSDNDDLESGLVVEKNNFRELTDDRSIKDVIKKVRKVVLIFKRSSLKNDTILQKYVKKEHGKELNLLLDCKTRWNSLFDMLERFTLIKTSVQKALIDLNNPVQFEESEFDLINEIINVLAPVKLSVEALSRFDANLSTADATFKFLSQQLSDNHSILASKLKALLLNRIKDRRRNELSGVLRYLRNLNHDSDDLDDDDTFKDFFSTPSKTFIKNQIISLAERMNIKNDCKEDDHNIQIEPASSIRTVLSLKEKLQIEIDNSLKILSPETCKEINFSKIIKQEISMFEGSSIRGYNLEQVYKYLLTIPPTSIESERAFSASAYMCTKFRSRLGDETLDALIFLRFYFLNLNKT